MNDFNFYHSSAQKGEAIHQLYLSYLLQYGTNCERDLNESKRWLDKAEKNGSSLATARKHYFGFGVIEDCKKAFEILSDYLEKETTIEGVKKKKIYFAKLNNPSFFFH